MSVEFAKDHLPPSRPAVAGWFRHYTEGHNQNEIPEPVFVPLFIFVSFKPV